ncbi:MAG: glycosyl hydrolase 115 family protein [Chitinophagaceae bacterium]
MRRALLLLLLSVLLRNKTHARFPLIENGNAATLCYGGHDVVVHTAIDILINDSRLVCSQPIHLSEKINGKAIIVGTPSNDSHFQELLQHYHIDVSNIAGRWETFKIQELNADGKNYLFVIGSDARGLAYGVLELSRIMGVSPWVWWADIQPEKKKNLLLPDNFNTLQSPSVQYRGIFLNDEDWGLNPWSSKTFEPGIPIVGKTKGAIGPKTYAKIFELLLRLRANTIWPAMHEVTVPFYFTKGNKEMADKYGITVGTAHCEPLMRNSAVEWDIAGHGDYNYLINKNAMLDYWTERLRELKNADNIYTIGLRGKHDGMMQGVKTLAEHKSTLQQVLYDERELLKKYINPDVTKIPQIFVPYKEVLDVYNDGLQVPDDVTLMWCDDNYGYITHFPNAEEKQRSGGNGVYYHVSYWGRPHDYLWLGTASPGLVYQQMLTAYNEGAKKIWILNVGDIKPAEYQTELFLDMAWNIQNVQPEAHLKKWLARTFGNDIGTRLFPVMQEYYRLAYIRKPEFMGNTRTEEKDKRYSIVKDLPWDEAIIKQRLNDYVAISDSVELMNRNDDAYFELIKYPVQAALQMNLKLLNAQLARHGKADWAKSRSAYDSIQFLTKIYNTLGHGKWNRMMDDKPRRLPVFEKVDEAVVDEPLPSLPKPLFVLRCTDYKHYKTKPTVFKCLGYDNAVVAIDEGNSLTYTLGKVASDSICVELHLLPSHPVKGKQLRCSVQFDDATCDIAYATKGRSEEWKENVLRNQAIRSMVFYVSSGSQHQLTVTAKDEGVVIDQIMIYKK